MIRTKQAGFTLIELILYIGLIGTVLLAATGFFAVSVDSRIKNKTISEVDQQATFAMDYMLQTIRNADTITAPAAAVSAAQLTLAVPTSTLSPTVFSLSGTSLQVKEGSAAAVALTNSNVQISNLTFTNLSRSGSPGVVRVSFVCTYTNAAGRNEYDYTKTFTSSAALRWP